MSDRALADRAKDNSVPGLPIDTDNFFVTGDTTGLAIPARPRALIDAGPDFLTAAMRAYGVLGTGNRIAAIVEAQPFLGGNSGEKLRLSVTYARPEDGLPTELFVKFSRCFPDPFRDRRREELAAEVRLAALSRHPAFPVAVPRACFADFHAASGTGLLITERIPFGERGILPLRAKCMDHLLPDAEAHYRAVLTALGQLAGAHKAGRLSPEVEALFPFDAEPATAQLPVPGGEAKLAERLDTLARFARECPSLLPEALASTDFLARVEHDSRMFLTREGDIRHALHADPDLVALAHWNGHLDNAWFWRDGDGALSCGLMDWGMVRQMPLGYALWGALSGSEPELLARRLDGLLDHFAAEYAAAGGPRLKPERLGRHFDVALMLLGQALMLDAPALVMARVPEARGATHRRDPVMLADPVASGFLHVFVNLLLLWQTRDFGASMAAMLDAG